MNKITKTLQPSVGMDIIQLDNGDYLYITLPYHKDVIKTDDNLAKLN